MKLKRAEKIWLISVIIFFFLYNLPFFPAYYHPKATIIHMILTIIPLWTVVYFGLFKMCRIFKLKKKEGE
ncbi:Uncharacterised protein [uncultured Roseburia sp.]|uniref:Uncharacterized protein n=1 Tax=Brotonthovivens ammoniilytica TaxID=2981725 RepID=A0ABT2TND7_9FIRM|nr:hypothetical protein [Brotonthovivens ammoniilytica]MCU6763748.1 hypothetical protein [Brotonthovivens ammoniilytica]SCJ33618.1 Uncharacterised protein [uncultured Roseburia sp.]